MTALVVVNPADALERAADPGEFVIVCAERGKAWLAEALANNDLDALVNIKGWAETLRVATMQKQLGKDAELSAAELVRRAERCIGLGIREGQARGAVAPPSRQVGAGDRSAISMLPTPTEITGEAHATQSLIYDLADGVTDEQFEQAIKEAKAERNLSRLNVIRKVKGETPPPPKRHEFHHRAPHVNAERIINESVAILEGVAAALALIEDVSSLDAEKRLAWLGAIREPLSAINHFKKELAG
jgi:hypothetical protein